MKKFFTADEEIETVENSAVVEEGTVEAAETEVGVKKVDPKPEPKATKVNAKIATVNVPTLNIRSDSKMVAPVIKIVPINTKLTIKGEADDFFEIEGPDNLHGYCKKQYLTLD